MTAAFKFLIVLLSVVAGNWIKEPGNKSRPPQYWYGDSTRVTRRHMERELYKLLDEADSIYYASITKREREDR